MTPLCTFISVMLLLCTAGLDVSFTKELRKGSKSVEVIPGELEQEDQYWPETIDVEFDEPEYLADFSETGYPLDEEVEPIEALDFPEIEDRETESEEADPRTRYIEEFSCSFVIGDGEGEGEIKIGNQRGDDCIKACVDRKRSNPHITGVSVWNKNKGGCWCEINMKTVDTNDKKYRTCFLKENVAVPEIQAWEGGPINEYSCSFVIGDGEGEGEIKIGNQRGDGCIKACVDRKQSNPHITGVSVWNKDKGGCWCEINMKTVDTNDKKYRTCFLKKIVAVPSTEEEAWEGESLGEYSCSFGIGDGEGEGEIKIENHKADDCRIACMDRKEKDPSINGVTVSANNKGECWCEKNMRYVDTNDKKYETCFLINEGPRYDYSCVFGIGDGMGRGEIKIGTQKGDACIKACVDRKQGDPDIDGVTVLANNKGGCWCEKKMTWIDSNDKVYKTCFLLNNNIDAVSHKCTKFTTGDGEGGGEIKIGNQKGDDCIKACVDRRRKDHRINGVTIRSDNSPGCWCELDMNKVDANDKIYRTCFLSN